MVTDILNVDIPGEEGRGVCKGGKVVKRLARRESSRFMLLKSKDCVLKKMLCLCFEFLFMLSIFSDFDGPMVPSVPLPPPAPFPVPPYPLSQLNRNQLIPYVRAVLKHIGPSGLDIGYGTSKAWIERFPVTCLSQRTRKLLGPGIETVAMGDFR